MKQIVLLCKFCVIILIVSFIFSFVCASDEQAYRICGGDDEAVVLCDGDNENHISFSPEDESTEDDALAAVIEETTPSGSSGGAPTYKVSSQNLLEGYSKRVYRNSRLSFEGGGEAHSLKVNSINYSGSSVNVTVSSEPQTKLLFVGDEWKVDLDNDSSYDLLVRLDGVSYGAAEIFVLEIDERYGFDSGTTDFTDEHGLDEVETANYANLREWIFVGVLVFLLVVGFFVFRFLKNGLGRKSGKKGGKGR